MTPKLKTSVYVDGFNLCYGCIRGTPFRWLDIYRMCTLLLPQHDISRIKYFTAIVSGRSDDLQKPQRQQVYLRALATLPGLEIVLGHFLTHRVRMRLANPLPGQNPYAEVLRTEEKGSDVNLATHLLSDGFLDDYECAVIVSNDSDLAAPIRVARGYLRKRVGLLNPHPNPSRMLSKNTDFWKPIRAGVLRASLFPDVLVDARGPIHKPTGW